MRTGAKHSFAAMVWTVILLTYCGCAQQNSAPPHPSLPLSGGPSALPYADINNPGAAPREPPPAGVRYLALADSLEKLREQTQPDLAWVDDDGVAIFCWVKLTPDGKSAVFTLDQAHQVLQDGRLQWGFFDPTVLDKVAFNTPLRQYFVLKFVRAEIKYPDDHYDGNNSSADLLSTDANGAAVYKITYCSEGGAGSSQERVRTYLIYSSPSGKLALATTDLGHTGNYPHTWQGSFDQFEFDLHWQPTASSASFEAKVRTITVDAVAAQDPRLNWPDLVRYQNGILSGPFPMKLKMDPVEYVDADGNVTLAALANSLVFYKGGPEVDDLLNSADRGTAKIRAAQVVLAKLQRLNPALNPLSAVPAGTHIVLPSNVD